MKLGSQKLKTFLLCVERNMVCGETAWLTGVSALNHIQLWSLLSAGPRSAPPNTAEW